MRLTLTLSPGREARLHEQARLAGLSVEEYALRVLDGAGLDGTGLDALAPLSCRLCHKTRLSGEPCCGSGARTARARRLCL